MSELSLELSEKFTEADASAIRAALNRHLGVREPTWRYRRSVDPPSIIQLLGAVAAWQVLVKPAAAFAKSFFSALGKRAADAAWDGAVRWKRNKGLRPLADVATALVAAADRVGGKVTISVGLDIPDDHFGTVVSTESRDAFEVARLLSAFVVRGREDLRRGTGRDRTRVRAGRAVLHGVGTRQERDDSMAHCLRPEDPRKAHTVDSALPLRC